MQPHAAKRIERRDLDIFREMELFETIGDLDDVICRDVQQHHVSRFQHVKVAQHPALWSQPCRITAVPWNKRCSVVCQEPLEKGGAFRTSYCDLPPGRNCSDYGAFMEGSVVVGGGHPRCFVESEPN